MRWCGPGEIAFRLRQETRNLALWARPPRLPDRSNPRAPFPDPAPAVLALQSTPTAAAIVAGADGILRHRFPLLGLEIDTGPEIRWRRDYISGKETPADYFREIPYLNPALAGDHKIVWELNRHQHLVLLAQAHRLTGRREYLESVELQLDSWLAQNPPQCGINWASALEVALRALSWMWVVHLAGDDLSAPLRSRLLESLYRHAFHLEANLSLYFSPNTHLLGEAVGLHALGVMFRGLPAARKWERLGAAIVGEQMQRQVRADGSHFEQSSYYHVYALDMFLFHAILARPPASDPYRLGLERMARYLEALIGPSRSLPFFGDDDGGRFFHPYGPRDRFGRATLAACGCYLERPEWIGCEEDLQELALWWIGPAALRARNTRGNPCAGSRRFPDAGMVVMRSGGAQCLVDAGPFGPFRGGHSHADTLSIVATINGQDLLIDPGTFTYVAEPWRGRFRGTAAHNTVRIRGLDQAEPAGPFGWQAPPRAEILEWQTGAAADFLDAVCLYRGLRHRRRVFFLKPELLLFILDDVEGEHLRAEQFWHLGGEAQQCAAGCFRVGDAGMLVLSGDPPELSSGGEFGWRSRAYGVKEPAPVVVCRRNGEAPVQFGALLAFAISPSAAGLAVRSSEGEVEMILNGAWNRTIAFPASGMPRLH